MSFSPNYANNPHHAMPQEIKGDMPLTPREKEVLSYLASGASNKDIADALGVQVVTVKLHVRGICRKLNVKNRTQAALKAGGMGVLPAY